MKASGLSRRIDELGRIVIPKEIRKNLGIREGENLKIEIEDSSIVLSKNSILKSHEEIVKKLVNCLTNVISDDVFVCDREKIIAYTCDIYNTYICEELHNLINERRSIIQCEKKTLKFKDEILANYILIPIISDSDCFGLVGIVSDTFKKENEILAKYLSILISCKIDIS